MSWWSLRRRLGATRDAGDDYPAPAPAPVTGHPPASAPPAGQPAAGPHRAGRQGRGPESAGWFEPGRGLGGYLGPRGPKPGRPGAPGHGPGDSAAAPWPGQRGGAPGEGVRYAGARFGRPYATGQYAGGQPGGAAQPAAARRRRGPPRRRPPSAVPPLSVAVPPHLGPQQNLAPPLGLAPRQALAPPPGPASPHHPETAPAATWEVRPDPGQLPARGPWPDICDQFGLHLLVLAEQLRTSLDQLEADEADPERLRRLYRVDHAVTRMRRASRDLRTLAGRSEEELAGFTTSLLDVIRMAASAIERYAQVTVGRVTDLAVLGYAADDIGSLMAALLDNATRYSPGPVTVSGHLLEDGGVMFRVEDAGIGIGADQVAALNALFAGPVGEVDERTGRHTGFPVVHRIARKHSIGVRLAARPQPTSGTVAMVKLPPHLLCEVPADVAKPRPAPAGAPEQPAAPDDLSRGEPTRPQRLPRWQPTGRPGGQAAGPEGELPRRDPSSLRGQLSGQAGPSQGPASEPRGQRGEQPAATPREQSAARRAFADDLAAFSQGASAQEATPPAATPPGTVPPGATAQDAAAPSPGAAFPGTAAQEAAVRDAAAQGAGPRAAAPHGAGGPADDTAIEEDARP